MTASEFDHRRRRRFFADFREESRLIKNLPLPADWCFERTSEAPPGCECWRRSRDGAVHNRSSALVSLAPIASLGGSGLGLR